METDNNGVIGLYDTRSNVDAMKKYYRAEYKKIIDKEKKADSDLFHNKWKVRLGTFAFRVGLTFHTRGAVKSFAKIGASSIGFITEKIMKLKNKIDKKKYQKEKDKLTADFINGEGDFKQFTVINSADIENIDYEVLKNGYGK